MSDIHPTAVVHPSASLGAGVRVGPYCVIGPEVTIGPRTELRSHVVVESHTRIGAECTLFQFACVGGTPQDRKFRGEVTWCELGDRNHLREHVTIHRGTGNGGGVTRIGDDNLIMVGAHVAHDVHIGNRCTIANNVLLAGHVLVEDDAAIAGCVGVHHFATIGRCSFVAGMTRVECDVPPYMTLGEGSRGVRFVPNFVGMTRRGFNEATMSAIREIHRVLWGPRSERLDHDRESPQARLDGLRRAFAAIPPAVELLDAYARSLAGVKGRANERHRADDKYAVTAHTSGAASIQGS
jgi:UDP-N-acetylglucosamine acyltransferase